MPSFDSNIRFVYFRAQGARARVYFLATHFLYFTARIARTPSFFFVNITIQNRRLDKEAQSHIVSKPNKRVMKRCLKCLKLEAPEMAKKPLLSLPINAQLVSDL